MVTINGYTFADVGYYINLDERADRRKTFEEQCLNFQITGIERFSANTSTNSPPLNCKLSHLQLYKNFLDTKYERLLVFEDDCLFLPYLFEFTEKIYNDIFSLSFDLFWLGCKNRRRPKPYKHNCYQVQSVSHAQSYIINRNLCEYILNESMVNELGLCIDELLCLIPFGKNVAKDPHSVNYYNMDSPLDCLPTHFISLCYEKPLTTQYPSYSNLVRQFVDYSDYITQNFI